MKRKSAFIAVACLLFAQVAWAHRIDEYLQATILSLDAREVNGSMRLIPGVLVASSVIAAIDSDHDGMFSRSEKQAYAQRVLGDLSITLDGRSLSPHLLSCSFPEPAQMREGLGEIHISYRVVVSQGGTDHSLRIANHHLPPASVYLMNAVVPPDRGLHILAQKRNESQSVYELDYQQTAAAASSGEGLRAWLNGGQFTSLFRLGMRQIGEGTDHLLFLLVLLLPAPLIAGASRWEQTAGVRQSLLRILSIVTAFTIGHSITLSLAAMNVVHVPEHPIEVLIAISILISAIHAMRPLFPGREAWIAAFFGLIHGLAFAATLDRLGLSRWERVAGILAFNLGIETMQTVATVLPSLLLLSRSRAYPLVRNAGAALAAAASAGWITERLFGVQSRVDLIVDHLARHAVVGAAVLFMVSLALRYLPAKRLMYEKLPPHNFSGKAV